MIEQRFAFAATDAKTIERVVAEDALNINHMVLPTGEGFPEHTANADVYMAVMRGELALELNAQPAARYHRGDLLKIPQGTLMRGYYPEQAVLELFIVKRFA